MHMKMNKTQRTAIIAGSVVLTAGVAALVWWIIESRRRYDGLVVIGGPSIKTNTNTNSMNTNNTNGTTNSVTSRFNDTSLPLGYRNNNPLNILYGTSLWKGKVIPNTDKSTPQKEQFISMAYGYRAALYLLRKHIRNGYNTLARLVNYWGSGKKSDAESNYVKFVSRKTGIGPGDTVDPSDMETMCRIAHAMAWFENGKAPSSYDDVYQGWALL